MQMKFKPAHEVANSRPKPRGPLGLGCSSLATGSAHWAIHRELSAESGALQLELETVVTIADSGSGAGPDRRRRGSPAAAAAADAAAPAAAQSGHSNWQAVPGRRGPVGGAPVPTRTQPWRGPLRPGRRPRRAPGPGAAAAAARASIMAR